MGQLAGEGYVFTDDVAADLVKDAWGLPLDLPLVASLPLRAAIPAQEDQLLRLRWAMQQAEACGSRRVAKPPLLSRPTTATTAPLPPPGRSSPLASSPGTPLPPPPPAPLLHAERTYHWCLNRNGLLELRWVQKESQERHNTASGSGRTVRKMVCRQPGATQKAAACEAASRTSTATMGKVRHDPWPPR